MHKQKRLSTRIFGAKALKLAAFSTLLVFSNAYATGLGKLTVLSSLGQPLRAEIELTSPNKEEINSLVPKVASIEAFRQANIEFNPALLSLRFAVEQRGNGYIIKVSSTQPSVLSHQFTVASVHLERLCLIPLSCRQVNLLKSLRRRPRISL